MQKPARRFLWLNATILFGTPLVVAALLPLAIARGGVHWSEPTALLVLWGLTGLGVTAGYHRMWSHSAWKGSFPVRAMLAVFGAAAWENSIVAWVADHRRHHRHADQELDPYNARLGIWHSHMGWALFQDPAHDEPKWVPDLLADPLCRWQHRWYLPISIGFNLLVPLALGLLTGRVLEMFLWAGPARVLVVHHSTFFINSLAHAWGSSSWDPSATARDNGILALFTLGEGYHSYHHAFPSDYRNGIRWYHYDPTKWLIWSLASVGLAERLRRTPLESRLRTRFELLRERFEQRLAAAGWPEAWRERVVEAEARLEAAFAAFRKAASEASERVAHGAERRALERELRQAFQSWHRTLQLAV